MEERGGAPRCHGLLALALVGLVVALAGAVGCGDDDEREIKPGPAPLRRLTRTEYNNTVLDLLGDATRPADAFPAEEEAFGFNNNADVIATSTVLVENYLQAAEAVAGRATGDLGQLLPCTPANDGDVGCAEEFIRTFGRRAFRRPLADEEVSALIDVFREASGRPFKTGLEMVLQAMLQAPAFLYRVEFGRSGESSDSVPVDGWERASRLSYLLWQTMPDEDLLQAAEMGNLDSAEDVLAQARRMLDDPRARRTVSDFHSQWLRLPEVDAIEKDPAVYPQFTPEIAVLMRREIEALLDHVIWDGGGDLTDIYTAHYSYLNKPLADFYGLTGPKGNDFVRVERDPTRSAGILTSGGLMSLFAKSNQSSPVHRGKFVRERILCQELPPPPPDIEIVPPDLDPNLTTRERFTQHRADPFCAGCHSLMDPVGLGFENFDGIGLWRDLENGRAIDSSGEIVDTDVDGKFVGPVELGEKLAQSGLAQDCLSLNWFRFAYGRTESVDDADTLTFLKDALADSHNDLRELLLALTQTDAFLYRPKTVADGEGGGQ